MTVSVAAVSSDGWAGVATASFALAVGAHVPQVRPGAGAIAIQAHAPAAWSNRILDELEAGRSATAVSKRVASWAGAEHAQVVVVDRSGLAATFSGAGLEAEVSHAQGRGVAAAGNLLERADAIDACVDAYLASAGATIGSRLLDALSAADAVGGDVRGRQSAALRTVDLRHEEQGPDAVDLRVDDARSPIAELTRLHGIHQAHAMLAVSTDAAGRYVDVAATRAALELAPDDLVCLGAAALALLRAGAVDAATPLLQRLIDAQPRTVVRMDRLVAAGHLPASVWQAARHHMS